MASKFYRRFSNFLKRDLIKKGEEKLTYVQILGCLLILSGIICLLSFFLPVRIVELLSFLKPAGHSESGIVSIAFFATMSGIVLAFPGLLKGKTQETGIMRIIVFLFVNVMGMIFLKYAWNKNLLTTIGANSCWVGVIAFLSGVKAAQAYFENEYKLAFKAAFQKKPDISQTAIAQLAKVQNEQKLSTQFPNVISVSDTLLNDKACLTIYLKDEYGKGILSFVPAEINKSMTIPVKTNVITTSCSEAAHFGQAHNELSNPLITKNGLTASMV